jgi:hypothetical protein
MRSVFSLVVAALLACTQQSVGQRCEQNKDCNGTNGEVCRSERSPAMACEGTRDDAGVPQACICCPADREAAERIPACRAQGTATDAAVPDGAPAG